MVHRTTIVEFEADAPAQVEMFDRAVRDFLAGAVDRSGLGGIRITHVAQSDRIVRGPQPQLLPKQEIGYLASLLLLDQGSFFWHVLMLVPRADVVNLERIRDAWPWIVSAYERWQDAPGGDVDVEQILQLRESRS